ncbi:MAG: substrate-binding domain-containing protein [Caldilineaceae bacterium]|nr:substrate-binding domain-containing protein [Caldilineaceae bacterium]
MIRTRVFVVAVMSAAVVLVVGILVWRTITGNAAALGLAPARPQVVRIQVITALSVESWVQAAADEFNATGPKSEGATIEVEITPMDGLAALGKWERNDFAALSADVLLEDLPQEKSEALESFPTAWIADGRFLVEIANASFREQLGRDQFLNDGQYRMRPLANTLLVWGLFRSRGAPLLENLGPPSWSTFHKAAVAPTGWKELGGDPGWGNFKLAVNPVGESVGGLAAIVTAAGEYFDSTEILVEDVVDPQFDTWLTELMGAAPQFSGGATSSAESVALFGYTAGDGGQFLESELLQNMEGIQNRRQEPVLLYYPKVTTWFDFPFAIWAGPETSAAQKEAALAFQSFLLSEGQQRSALEFGLRPAESGIQVSAAEGSLFEQWRRLGVEDNVSSVNVMQSLNRELLSALLRRQEMNEKR